MPKIDNISKVVAAGAAALAVIAGVIVNVKTLSDFIGDTFALVKEGETILPTCNSHHENCAQKTGDVAFPEPFGILPVVTSANHAKNPGVPDAFDFPVVTTTRTGFTVRMTRIDSADGWAGHPKIKWRAVAGWWAKLTREKAQR